jgi:hypothetical protein
VLPTSQQRRKIFYILFALTNVFTAGCRPAPGAVKPGIEITQVPPKGEGSSDKLEPIAGRIRGRGAGRRVVLFALSGVWWVQPLAEQPFTAIQADYSWKAVTHPGTTYAALLVDSRYSPPMTMKALPETGGPILAETIVAGASAPPPKVLQFSGYQWEVRRTGSDHGGNDNLFSPENAWTDTQGALHLRVSKQKNNWVSAEVKLTRSLGYGSYRFVVRDSSHLEPASVFAVFTWDDAGPAREMDIEVSRWGEPEDKSAQFVIQPYVVPANTVRFEAPPGVLTYWMNWGQGRVAFRSVRGAGPGARVDEAHAVAEHVFTSGVPSAGSEKIHMNVYVYNNRRHPLQHEFEVVVEKFEFLP